MQTRQQRENRNRTKTTQPIHFYHGHSLGLLSNVKKKTNPHAPSVVSRTVEGNSEFVRVITRLHAPS
jgi:hypothetical protein